LQSIEREMSRNVINSLHVQHELLSTISEIFQKKAMSLLYWLVLTGDNQKTLCNFENSISPVEVWK